MKNQDRYLIRPIRNAADYKAALALAARYFDNEPESDSDAGAHFEAMLTLIEVYEARNCPISSAEFTKSLIADSTRS